MADVARVARAACWAGWNLGSRGVERGKAVVRWVLEAPEAGVVAPALQWFEGGLRPRLAAASVATQVVWNLFPSDRPRPYRRRSQAVFCVGVTCGPAPSGEPLQALYPLLIRSLSNLLVYLVPAEGGDGPPAATYFVTLERGCYALRDSPDYFTAVLERVQPLAGSHLVIDNVFVPDLPPHLADGNERTRQMAAAARRLQAMDLLPAPFPIEKLLDPKDFAHLRRMFQLGGLSYGNVSVREPGLGFWMSASGVDKSHLERVGEEILLVRGFDGSSSRMIVSVPPDVQPRRVSVDAIEHWLIYQAFPAVGAILHVHAWMGDVVSTDVNYPCGTLELATAVRDRLAGMPDPGHAVVGLRNHGLTITGENLPEIFERVEGRLLRQVPMQ
jgi:ribulose-5-phosphate 4-epimerase/fuculose-1-phosphate aldolase